MSAGSWIRADCRIDNRAELAAELKAMPGFQPDGPDSAYILQAYLRWGEEAPRRLLGDFAFGIWDERKKQFFCARDPLGLKPFYYHWDGRRFLFGSEIQQILQDSSVPSDPNLAHLTDLLLMSPPGQSETPYEAVRKLPPGRSLRIREGELEIKPYFEWKPAPEKSNRSLQENAGIFRELFLQSVRDRLRAGPSGRAGSLLSGGLDSSAIVAAAAPLQPVLPVFTLSFPEADPRYKVAWADWVDETSYVERMAAAYPGLEPHAVRISSEQFLEDLRDSLQSCEEPLPFPLFPCYRRLFRGASDAGVQVMLNGEGGDELFWAPRKPPSPPVSFLPKPVKGLLRKLLRRDIPSLIRPEFARKASLPKEDFPSSGILQVLRSGVLPFHLEVFYRLAAGNGMEVRYPFLDLRLIQFMASVPSDQKMAGGQRKILLREAMKELLPPEVRLRAGKSEYSPVIRTLLDRAARPLLEEALERPHPALDSMVRMKEARRLYRTWFFSPQADKPAKNVLSLRQLWYLMTVDQWLKSKRKVDHGKKEGTEAIRFSQVDPLRQAHEVDHRSERKP